MTSTHQGARQSGGVFVAREQEHQEGKQQRQAKFGRQLCRREAAAVVPRLADVLARLRLVLFPAKVGNFPFEHHYGDFEPVNLLR